MNTVSDYEAYVCQYFNIPEIKMINENQTDIRTNLRDVIGPLDSPIVKIANLFDYEAKVTLKDIVVKVLGLSPVYTYETEKHKGIYQRILGIDTSDIIELTFFKSKLVEENDIVRITNLQTYVDENTNQRQIKITAKTKIYRIPFHLPEETLSLEERIPDAISLNDVNNHQFYNLRAIVKEIGSLENTIDNKNKKISKLHVILMAKDYQLDLMCKKRIANIIKRDTNIFDVIYVKNIQFKTLFGKIIAYTTDYSSFKYTEIPKEKQFMPKKLQDHDLPVKTTDIISLFYDSTIIGRIRCKILPPMRKKSDFGEYYQTAIIDSSASSLLTIKSELISKITIDSFKQVELTGVCKSSHNNLVLNNNQIHIVEDNKPLALAFITPEEIEDMVNVFSLNVKFIERQDPRPYSKADGTQGTFIRAKFELTNRIITITAFNDSDKFNINVLKVNKYYNAYFLGKNVNNSYTNICFTPFTFFELDKEKNE